MAHQRLCILLLPVVLLVNIRNINAQTSDDVRKILKELFVTKTYNTAVRPIFNQTLAMNVNITYNLIGIIDFDSQKEILSTTGYLQLVWNDHYVQWKPADYNLTLRVLVPPDKVWKPDISLQNDVIEFKRLGSSDLSVIANSDGTMEWYPFAIVQSTCKVDITYFPFDTQTCKLSFTSWTYFRVELEFTVENDGVVFYSYVENSAWTVIGSSVDRMEQSEDATVVFTMKLKRKPLFFLLNVIVPVIMLSLMNACVFVLPADSGEKASFSVTVFLALAVFLTIVTAMLPQNSDKVSYLGIYMVIMTGFSTLTVILTLFQLRLNYRDVNADPIPSWLIKLQSVVETVRCRSRNKVQTNANPRGGVLTSGSVLDDSKGEKTVYIANLKVVPLREEDAKSKITWNTVCNALDFVFFWIYFAAICISTVIMIYILPSRAE